MSDRRDENAVAAVRANFEEFKRKHPNDFKTALGMATGRVKTERTQRQAAYAWAESMVEHMDAARHALDGTWENPPGSVRIAKWLNDHDITYEGKGGFTDGVIDVRLYGVADRLAEQSVMECRTRMTARAMSADFRRDGDDAHELETECVRQIAEALTLVARLQGQRRIDPAQILREAKIKAVDLAQSQRDGKYYSMIARECHMKDDEFDQLVPEIFALEIR